MPGFDRTGPTGEGPRTGGGFGKCGRAAKRQQTNNGSRTSINQDNEVFNNRRRGRSRRTGQRGRGSRGLVQESS